MGLFDGQFFVITPDTGARIAGWLGESDSSAPAQKAPQGKSEEPSLPEKVDQVMKARCTGLTPTEKAQVAARLKEIAGTANYRAVTDARTLQAIYDEFKEADE